MPAEAQLSSQIWLCTGWFAETSCMSEQIPSLHSFFGEILQTANSIVNSFCRACVAGDYHQHSSLLASSFLGTMRNRRRTRLLQFLSGSPGLPFRFPQTRRKIRHRTKKDPPTFCTMSFLVASLSRFSSFQYLGVK